MQSKTFWLYRHLSGFVSVIRPPRGEGTIGNLNAAFFKTPIGKCVKIKITVLKEKKHGKQTQQVKA